MICKGLRGRNLASNFGDLKQKLFFFILIHV